MGKRDEHVECFYCGALVSGANPGDHFPIPKAAGGAMTVACCISCHDMKDRFNLLDWPLEWMSKVAADFPKLSRETRLFISRVIRLGYEAQAILQRSDKTPIDMSEEWAKNYGKGGGHPFKVFDHEKAQQMWSEGKSLREIGAELGVSKDTVRGVVE